MNIVIIAGNLGSDPEVHNFADGGSAANANVATKSFYKKKEHTEWHRVTAYGKTAEFLSKHFNKGKGIIVTGSLRTRKWEKDDEVKYTTEIVANKLEFAPGNGRKETHNRAGETPSSDGW